MADAPDRFSQPILSVARRDVTTLAADLTVRQALEEIRQQGLGEKVVYFYVVNADRQLVGVVPTRRLLTAPLEQRLAEIMVRRLITISERGTVLDACELFLMHRFLALPVVDDAGRIVGVVDAGLLTEEVLDLSERENTDALFEAIGFHVAQVRDASVARMFRYRFPWLVATVSSGILCAWLTSAFEMTLANSIVLAFFLTLILGLGESVSIQSMTVAIQSLRALRPTWRWYRTALRREVGTAVLLGLACGAVVGLLIWLWRGAAVVAVSVGGSIVLALGAACVCGLSVPALLHALNLDPKIAAGPITLAVTDIFTLLFYFGLGRLLLGG